MRKGCRAHIHRKVVVDDAVMASTNSEFFSVRDMFLQGFKFYRNYSRKIHNSEKGFVQCILYILFQFRFMQSSELSFASILQGYLHKDRQYVRYIIFIS